MPRDHAPSTRSTPLADHLDTMLASWLDGREAPRGVADTTSTAIVTVRDEDVGQVELVCMRWGMRVTRTESCPGTPWTVMTVSGRAHLVRGFARVARLLPRT
jgi:hypothetical protein